MVSFEIAKRLKIAGFPQRFHSGYAFNEQGLTVRLVGEWQPKAKDTGLSIPTLNELIKACGERFGGLEHNPHETRNRFRAYLQLPDTLSGYGDTPEEAVARLWLVLNKR
jgi:hypothetical protein